MKTVTKIVDSEFISIITTDRLLNLIQDSQDRETKDNYSRLKRKLDPIGIHILKSKSSISKNEIRTEWFIKFKNKIIPKVIWLDIERKSFRNNIIKVAGCKKKK